MSTHQAQCGHDFRWLQRVVCTYFGRAHAPAPAPEPLPAGSGRWCGTRALLAAHFAVQCCRWAVPQIVATPLCTTQGKQLHLHVVVEAAMHLQQTCLCTQVLVNQEQYPKCIQRTSPAACTWQAANALQFVVTNEMVQESICAAGESGSAVVQQAIIKGYVG
jgi:hypothetical protein